MNAERIATAILECWTLDRSLAIGGARVRRRGHVREDLHDVHLLAGARNAAERERRRR